MEADRLRTGSVLLQWTQPGAPALQPADNELAWERLAPATRDPVDERTTKLGAERDAIERRIDELDRMALSSAEIEALVEETP